MLWKRWRVPLERASSTSGLQNVELYRWHRERDTGLIENATLTLHRETINWFKAQTGQDGETGGTARIMPADSL